jgi:hypothetical protein
LKNPWIAGTLAFLIPGAGHLYQGRLFKGILYAVCILGTFFYGLHLGEWRNVYHRWQPDKRNLGYLSQIMVGLPALPALIQSKRFTPPYPNDPWIRAIDEPITAHFEGTVTDAGESSPISGDISLAPVPHQFGGTNIEGTLTGTLNGQTEVVLVMKQVELQPDILADPQRRLQCRFVEDQNGHSLDGLRGGIPRPFWNWFEVPLDDDTENRLHGDLGKWFELAALFTWIAGLLNVLAIWDALEGPAYGYGDEPSPKNKHHNDEELPRDAGEMASSAQQPAEKMAATT